MHKKKITLSILAVALLFGLAWKFSNKKEIPAVEISKVPTRVSVRSAEESKKLLQKSQYPATIVGDQEVKITARVAGTILSAPGEIGTKVSAGSLLAKIDDNSSLSLGSEGLRNLQVRQAEISAKQAEKNYNLAKDLYSDLKKSSGASDEQKDVAKAQRDIAKLQYENALLGVSGSADSHLLTSPISGVITNKAVSLGDSVSVGQLIATVSKSSNLKIQFYVDQEQRKSLLRGEEILASTADGETLPFVIKNIAAAADQVTKRFLIEAYPQKTNASQLLAGTIATISIEKTIKPEQEDNLLLPLSAINIGQNENHIFVLKNNIVQKEIVSVKHVLGESAEVSASISPETLIIIDGNKLVQEGESVNLKD